MLAFACDRNKQEEGQDGADRMLQVADERTRLGFDPADRRGWVGGLPPKQFFVATMHARRALGQVALDTTRAAYDAKESARAQGLGVLVRAMRSARPGVVFARAAATGEIDPLTDLDSRLFVGLPVTMG